MSFDYCDTASTTTAVDVLASRAGVCRDFAHLGVALCRALSIPARYAFGYLPDIGVPPSGHADRLLRVDGGLPRRPVVDLRSAATGSRGWGRVLIGRGRDALDVAMVSTFGAVELESMVVWADQVVG